MALRQGPDGGEYVEDAWILNYLVCECGHSRRHKKRPLEGGLFGFLKAFLPNRHMIAALPALLDDVDFTGLLEVVEYLFEVLLGFSIPFSDTIKPDIRDIE